MPDLDASPLDRKATYDKIDPSRMAERLLGLPQQALDGWQLAETAVLSPLGSSVDRVVIAGMGGSAIGGELIKGLADAAPGAAQIACWRDWGIPSWVDEKALVLAVSVSGGTAETRSAFAAAGNTGANRIAITGPGPLLAEAQTSGIPAIPVSWDHEPRAGLGFTFMAPYRALQKLGLLPDATADLGPALDNLRDLATDLHPDTPFEENTAKQLAAEIGEGVPVTYGARHLLGVAMRWKTQFNENADAWAAWEAMPEANHNAIQGCLTSDEARAGSYVFMLKSGEESRELDQRIITTLEILSTSHVHNAAIEIAAPNRLGEILAGSLLGDMTAYYLAIQRGQDPSLTRNLTELKSRNMPADSGNDR